MKEKINPKMDEYWVARIRYWPEDETRIEVVYIYYVWESGEIDFIACAGDGSTIRASRCDIFELLERIEVEKYE